MASQLRQLAPHVGVMLLVYFLVVLLVALITGHSSFWTSILIALLIAFVYPPVVRRLGKAPQVWKR